MKELFHFRFEYFLKTAQESSVLSAAQKIGVSQPALSGAIKRLEEDLKTKLFERSVRGITLTEAGQALYTELMSLQKDAQLRVSHSLGQTEKTLLRVGCVGHLASKYLLTILEDLKTELPKTHLFTSNSLDCYEEVQKGNVEFAFIAWSSKPKTLKHIRIADEPVAYVGLKTKFAQIEKIHDLDELRKLPWVDLPKPQKDWTQILEPEQNGFLARDVRILRDIVLRGFAVGALQLNFFSKEEKKLLAYSPIPPPYADPAIYAVYRKDISKSSMKYLEMLSAEFSKAATARD